jgi:hypothetical protein
MHVIEFESMEFSYGQGMILFILCPAPKKDRKKNHAAYQQFEDDHGLLLGSGRAHVPIAIN